MNQDIRELLAGVRDGVLSVDDAMLRLKIKPFEDIGYAKVDMHRRLRQGVAEVIYGAGKTAEQIIGIVDAMEKNGQNLVLITRLCKGTSAFLLCKGTLWGCRRDPRTRWYRKNCGGDGGNKRYPCGGGSSTDCAGFRQ